MASPRAAALSWLASQLGRPRGPAGSAIALMLNRGNRRTIGQAVGALELTPGAVAADLGFGGGIGLSLLLEGVGDTGRVYGVDL